MLKTAVSIVEKLLVQRPIASLDNLDFKALGTTLMDTDIDKVRSLYFFEMGIWSDEYLTEEDLKTLSDLYDGIGALDYAGAFEGSSKYKSIDIFKLISNGHDKTDLDSARSQSLWELQQWDLKSIPDGFRLDQNMVDLYSILRDVALDVEVSEKLERLSWIGSRLTSIDADPLKCKAINTCVSLANEQPRRLWDLDNCDQFDLALISLDPKKKSEQCELSAILLGRAQKANSIGDFKHISGQIQNLIKGNFIEEEDSIEYSGMLLVLKGEQAKFLWEKGKQEEAIELMKSGLFAMPNCPINDVFLREYTSLAFSQVGEWVFSTKSERPLAIKENYLDASLKVIGGFPSNPRTLAKIYSTYAKFVDHLFDQMSSSENLEFREKLLKQAKADVEALARLASSRRDDQALRSALKSMEQQYLADSKEFKEIERARTSFLLLAVENYLRCLQLVDTYDLSVFRICALWFEHYGKVMEVSKLISNALGKVACHKFLPLIYQLAARAELSETKQAEQEAFQDTLERLLMRMASKHPYHCVYQILALKAGSMGNKTGPAKRRLVYAGESLEDRRAAAAASLIGKLKGSDARVSRIVTAIERVCEGYIELADVELDASETKPNVLIPFDAKWTIRKLGSCPDVGIPTRSIPVDPSGAYADLVSIAGFGEGFKVVGGINLPKIIECLGSDGRSYRQLVKGKDDVRQDAVMEQVFVLVDQLLKASEATRLKGLGIRTYRIIPLHALAGLLEWVSDTIPIGDYLIPAHERIHPTDLPVRQCRVMLKAEFDDPASSPQSKLRTYNRVCERFSPVLRHFFWETATSPANWWERRCAYVASCAASSMLGYVVGLGDRHCQNILLDRKTGELVQIDLNMIFEMGKQLRIPERVPFRLTRDIVDGMGPAGTRGGFERSAEAVLRMLRSQSETILMIIEVFKYDPLYKWKLNPIKAARRMMVAEQQQGLEKFGLANAKAATPLEHTDDAHTPPEADRALLRVKEKLLGTEEGSQLSERGQVQYLIQQATSVEALSQMYPGWSPFI